MMKNKSVSFFLFSILALLVSSCSPRWEISLTSSSHPQQTILREDVIYYLEKSTEEIKSVPLGQVLYAKGYSLIETINFRFDNGSSQSFNWDSIAMNTQMDAAGKITSTETIFEPDEIEVVPSQVADGIKYSIMDIAPTMAHALGFAEIPNAEGINRLYGSAEQGALILMDGLQYNKLTQLIERGNLSFLGKFAAEIHQGITVYPPITTCASAALLTSVPPHVNGVFGYGYRSTESVTLFDLAAEAGLSVKAIEGSSLPFNLRNAETTLSGDRDGNGFSDDNVFKNSLEVIESDMPGLLYIHFHEIDDMGHSYGPQSADYEVALIRVDSYLSKIYQALPEQTLIAIFSDHGMHVTEEGGNHGTLTAEDLIIPILFIHK